VQLSVRLNVPVCQHPHSEWLREAKLWIYPNLFDSDTPSSQLASSWGQELPPTLMLARYEPLFDPRVVESSKSPGLPSDESPCCR
jgi:hypothetical protein